MRYDYLRSGDTKSGATTSFSLLGVPFDVVANIPVGFLDVKGEARSIVVDNPLRSSGVKVCKLKTLGELAAFGYEKLNRIIRTSYYPQKSFSQIMYEIQVALARFSMKLRGTDFTIFDIRLDDLNLTDEARKFVREQGATNLGDLYIDYKVMNKVCSVRVRDSIREALLEFGSRPEVSGSLSLTVMKREKATLEATIRNARERVFPSITKYAPYSISEPLSSLYWASGTQYAGAECDYSGLIREFISDFVTEEEIIVQTGIDEAILENIKKGKVLPINVYAKLCKYFEKNIDSLVAFNDPSKQITQEQISEFEGVKKIAVSDNRKKPAQATVLTPVQAEPIVATPTQDETLVDPYLAQEDESEILDPTNLDIKAYDYSPLFKKIDEISSIASFSKMYKISYTSLKRMQQGMPVSYRLIEKLAKILGCHPNELYVTDMQKIEDASAEWIKQEQKRNKDKEFDYTLLKLKLAERLMSVDQMCEILDFDSDVRTCVSDGTKIAEGDLGKIQKFLGCSAEEILSPQMSLSTFEESEQTQDVSPAVSDQKEEGEPLYDYSGLFNLMKQRKVTKQMLAKDALVHGYIFTYQISKGFPISKMYLKRLCMYFNCREEDLVRKKYGSILAEETSRVNLGQNSGTTRVRPYSPQTGTEESSEFKKNSDGASGGVGSGNGRGVKPKFYMGRNGFLNQEHDIVKLHRERPMLDSEVDFIERQF